MLFIIRYESETAEFLKKLETFDPSSTKSDNWISILKGQKSKAE